ncbi:hypothetical protein ACFCY8_11450 [Streptomyces noursei]|uniref:hypothetical protein n=1 Tax=Streptomyces noursei TaxID=1971 RepID=UPI0035E2EFEF
MQIEGEPAWYTGKLPLICWKCDAGVHGKGTYVKGNGASYRAHFALNPRTSHAQTCPFNPVKFITTLAQGAQGMAHVEDGVLRLTLPDSLEDLAPVPEPTGPPQPPDEATARRISTVPPALPPLLNCAAKIARFLQLNAFDNKIVQRFRVQPHGYKSTIPWGRFCYGPTATAYGQLVKRLDPDSPGRAPLHPVAVYGTVQRVGHDRTGRPFVFLADHADLDGREFEVVLRSMHPSLITPLTVGTHVLAVGTWGIFTDSRVPQLRLFAEEAWQIAYWHTHEDTGVATQPCRPPALTAHQRATERPAHGPSAKARRRPGEPPVRRAPPAAVPSRPAPLPTPTPPEAAASDTPRRCPQPPPPPAPPADAHRTAPSAPGTSPAPVPHGQEPDVPATPPRPPLPASPPPPARRRRKRLPGWLGRSRRRRR